MEKKKLIILTSDDQKWEQINHKITRIVSTSATELTRYKIIDRNQLKKILKEQKLQHSGVVGQEEAIEIGKIAGANEALLIEVNVFGQKGVPDKKQKQEDDEPKTGLFGWIVKEVVKAEIDKNMEDVERYPNNIQTIIDGTVLLINIETGQLMESFAFGVDFTGGVKSKSLSNALKLLRDQISNELKKLYQLRTEVLDIQGSEVTLLLGNDMGIDPGALYEIITRDKKKILRSREITIPGKQVGLVEVESTSKDASLGKVIRKWDEIKPGYQARELPGGSMSVGIVGSYGYNPQDMSLSIAAIFNPLKKLGGDIFGSIGVVKDTRQDNDFHFGFGISLHYRLLRSSSFSLVPLLSIPFDVHIRNDDEYQDASSHLVFLPILSPRIGAQTEIMISPKIDLVIRGEYILTNANIGEWRYTEENYNSEDEDGEKTLDANWNEEIEPPPDIYYHGWDFTIGIRILNFIQTDSKGFSIGKPSY